MSLLSGGVGWIRLVVFLMGLCLGGGGCLRGREAFAGGMPPLKIGEYNIHGGVGVDGESDLGRIAGVLKAASADVIALNEVDRNWFGDDEDRVIAQKLGPEWTAVFGKTINKPLRDYGNAIVTRLPIVSSQSWLLKEFPGQERRGLLRVTVQVGEERVHVFCTHMALNATVREENAREILAIMDGFRDGYRVLMGDFNEQRSGAAVQLFADRFKDCWELYALGSSGDTYSSRNPLRRIDFMWLDEGLSATSCYVARDGDARAASDHLPMFAEVVADGTELPGVGEASLWVNGAEELRTTGVLTRGWMNGLVSRGLALMTKGTPGVAADHVSMWTGQTVYREDFNSSSTEHWRFLDGTKDRDCSGGVATVGGEKFWRQRSERSVMYNYAPAAYPEWRNYVVSARIKTVSTGGGAWRMVGNVAESADLTSETYGLEVARDADGMPMLRIMKGSEELSRTVLSDYGVDPYDWNVYGLEVSDGVSRLMDGERTDGVGTRAGTGTLVAAYVNGEQVAMARDGVAVRNDGAAGLVGGSVGLVTEGTREGWCEIYADDMMVQRWVSRAGARGSQGADCEESRGSQGMGAERLRFAAFGWRDYVLRIRLFWPDGRIIEKSDDDAGGGFGGWFGLW